MSLWQFSTFPEPARAPEVVLVAFSRGPLATDVPPEVRDEPRSAGPSDWLAALAGEADRVLAARPGEAFDLLSREFERTVIGRALAATGGRRIEAAQSLGIGRNTITRKIQELGIDDGKG